MEIGTIVYIVEVDYAKFKFSCQSDAMNFATAALTHGKDGVRVSVDLVWVKKENETEEM